MAVYRYFRYLVQIVRNLNDSFDQNLWRERYRVTFVFSPISSGTINGSCFWPNFLFAQDSKERRRRSVNVLDSENALPWQLNVSDAMDGRLPSQVFAMTRLSLWFCLFFSPAVSFHDGDDSRHGFLLKPLERSIDDKSQINRLVSFEKSQSLAGGRYVTTTDIRQILALGNDLAAIDSTENFEEIEHIYRVGNAGILNETDAKG